MTLAHETGAGAVTGEAFTELIAKTASEANSSHSLLGLIDEGEHALRSSIVDSHDSPRHARFEAEWPGTEIEAVGRLAISTELLRVDQRAVERRIRNLRRELAPYDGVRVRVASILPGVAPIAVMHEWRNECDSWTSEPKLTQKRHIAVAEGKIALDRSIWWGDNRALPLLRKGAIELIEPGLRRDRIANNIYHVQAIDPQNLTAQVAVTLID
ncbi:hypothetical protein KC957_01115 [Candidatus Saccharibacteria bacterium]|nr:hypothetical protein [Candidatus Saccharibacteria bacterium]